MTSMTERTFFDTNVLVYRYDRRDPIKQLIAQELLKTGIENETAVVSAQVLGEFFTTVTRKIQSPLSIEEAQVAVNLISSLPVVALDLALVKRAIGTQMRYQISYWDALIVAAAESADCTRILTEDLNPGQSYHGIVVVNPF
jgi:predicted nucleic acid-binding protein